MSDYVVNRIARDGKTVTRTDTGGTDWLIVTGSYKAPTAITLAWANDGGSAVAAAGTYWIGDIGSRLIVEGRIENARGSDSADDIQGNERANILYGDQGSGGAGGRDTLFGGEGNDTIYGGANNDEIGGAEDADRLFGNAGSDTISGGDGADTIEGGSGKDDLSGGADLGDTISYASSNKGVTIRLTYGSEAKGSGGHAEGDVIRGFTDAIGSAFGDRITDTNAGAVGFDYNKNRFDGGGGSDVLTLGGGNDRGIGGTGHDTLTGGLGRDTLTGGTGKDRFVYAAVAESTVGKTGRDTITDFSRAQGDRIDLRGIDADAGSKGNQAFDFIGTKTFTGAGGEIRTIREGSGIFVLGDLDGDRKADFAILLQHVTSMKEADFLL